MRKINFFDLKLNNFKNISNNESKSEIYFLNPHSFVQSRLNYSYNKALYNAKNIYIDGVLLWFFIKFRILFKFKVNRTTGFDFTNNYLKSLYNKNIFLLGTNNKTLIEIKKKIIFINPTLRIFVHAPPYIEDANYHDVNKIVKIINRNKIHTVFIGMTSPKQEVLSHLIFRKIKAKRIISIGAVFDYLSRPISPFFLVMRKIGFEWLYRFIKSPRKIFPRIFISNLIFLFIIIYESILNVKNNFCNVYLIKDINLALKKKTFILAAFNLAFYSYLFKVNFVKNQKFYLWIDGIFSKLFISKYFKYPGRILIKNLKLNKNIKRIHLVGNNSSNIESFLKKKYLIDFKFSPLPYGDIKSLTKAIPKVRKSDLILINVPTPKQEIIASHINNKNKYSKIICIGGGLAIAAKDEKECPIFLEKLYLEFLWRLQYQTFRRLLRLLETIFLLILSIPIMFHKKIIIKNV